MTADPAIKWSPIRGNCNAVAVIDHLGTIRCTYLDRPHRLHRTHFDSGPNGRVLIVWGESAEDVSMESLAGQTNPLDLPAAASRSSEEGDRQ